MLKFASQLMNGYFHILLCETVGGALENPLVINTVLILKQSSVIQLPPSSFTFIALSMISLEMLAQALTFCGVALVCERTSFDDIISFM